MVKIISKYGIENNYKITLFCLIILDMLLVIEKNNVNRYHSLLKY